MSTTKELTAKQKLDLKRFYNEAIDIAFNTNPADRAKAENAIAKIYAKDGLRRPEFVWVRSPKEAKESIESLGGEWFLTDLWGQHDIYWIQHYRFAEHIGVDFKDDSEYLATWYELALSAMWWWSFDTHCFVCERPEILQVDDDGEPHNENGPAIRFRDGVELYYWNGHEVPKYVITNPEEITIQKITDEANAEVRRIMISRMGPVAYLQGIGATHIHSDKIIVGGGVKDETGADAYINRGLFKDKFGNQFLVGHDGSTERIYFMSVDPKVKTCADAHYSISGFKDEEILASG